MKQLLRFGISNVDRVDQTMDSIREQMELSNEISEAISNPVGMGNMVDEVGLTRSHTVSQQLIQVEQDELRNELEALEQEELDDRLRGAERVPVHTPVSPVGVSSGRESKLLYTADIVKLYVYLVLVAGVAAQAEEDDEEAQLRQLQAELAM